MMAARASMTEPGLLDLLHGMTDLSSVRNIPIKGLATDSREVKPDYLFMARVFKDSNAIPHIDTAIKAGAAAVIAEEERVLKTKEYKVPLIPVRDLQAKVGIISDRFYAHPSADLNVIGITGTNGKSSICHILAQALSELEGSDCGVIGTLGYGDVDHLQPCPNTTPEPVLLQRLLAGMRDEKKQNVVIEVSSHGIDQHRIAGVQFAAAVFTNLSQDHLDYHQDMSSYADVKSRLFTEYRIERAVINADDLLGKELLHQSTARHKIAYTLNPALKKSDANNIDLVCGVIVNNDPGRMVIDVTTPWGEGQFATMLAGRFNVYNLLASLSVLCLQGYPLPQVLKQLAGSKPIPGRMELFGGEHKPVVYVDYAHTPDALDQVLQAARQQCQGNLICVFGCGGDRDRDKRAKMGRIAAAHADQIILTSDNPRTEDPEEIIAAIQSGAGQHRHVAQVTDREQAIITAINSATSSDIIVVAGKGHETYQEIAGVRRAFSDQAVVRQALEARP